MKFNGINCEDPRSLRLTVLKFRMFKCFDKGFRGDNSENVIATFRFTFKMLRLNVSYIVPKNHCYIFKIKKGQKLGHDLDYVTLMTNKV